MENQEKGFGFAFCRIWKRQPVQLYILGMLNMWVRESRECMRSFKSHSMIRELQGANNQSSGFLNS